MVQKAFIQAQKLALNASPSMDVVLQRKAPRRCLLCSAPPFRFAPKTVPLIMNEALRSPGQLLDAATRALMVPRIGHDFIQAQVHMDAQAMGVLWFML